MRNAKRTRENVIAYLQTRIAADRIILSLSNKSFTFMEKDIVEQLENIEKASKGDTISIDGVKERRKEFDIEANKQIARINEGSLKIEDSIFASDEQKKFNANLKESFEDKYFEDYKKENEKIEEADLKALYEKQSDYRAKELKSDVEKKQDRH